eukprot:m.133654 g.133654  ORF g.133654 m.133654 type:complete len:253 (-) comp13844_c0_seq2:422-1180(-)
MLLTALPVCLTLDFKFGRYLGTYSTGLSGIARMLHDEGKLLCVDSAWAPHLGFHPELPPHALAQGADLMVTSFHKTLPAVSGAAAVFARTGLLAQHLDPSVDALTTTSPPGAALASIDGCRALVDSPYGSELLGELLSRVNRLKEALRIAGVPLLEDSVDQQQSVARFDPTKVVVHASGFGASGIDVERRLRSVDMPVELADNDFLVRSISRIPSSAVEFCSYAWKEQTLTFFVGCRSQSFRFATQMRRLSV